MESQTTENNQKKMNLPRFLLSLLIKPRQAFTQLDQTGKPHFLWAVGAMLIIIWLGPVLTLPITQREAAAGIDAVLQETGDTMSEEYRASMEQSKALTTNPAFLIASQGIMQTIAYPFLWASAAGVLYLLSLAFGGQARFGSILSMTIWASVAEILGMILLILGTLASGSTPHPGLSYLVSTESITTVTPITAALAQILSKITIFEIWYLVLIGIGVGVCAKVTRVKSAVITILYWLISLIPPVAMAVIGAAITSMTLG
jgi:hypothetical protein